MSNDLIKTEVACTFRDCDNKTVMYWPEDRKVERYRCKECRDAQRPKRTHKTMSEMIFDQKLLRESKPKQEGGES